MALIERLVRLRRFRIIRELMLLYGLEIQPSTTIGRDLVLQHRGIGTAIHPAPSIGDRVMVYHQVATGRTDGHVLFAESKMTGIEMRDDAVLYPGSKVLGGPGATRVGSGRIIAANAVLTRSTGNWKMWGGIPAQRNSYRTQPQGS